MDIKLIVLDVDGTLTDGKIIIGTNGEEYKNFDVKDGMGIAQALKCDIEIAIITGRNSNIVEIRSNELGIKDVFQGVKNKKTKLLELVGRKKISLEEVAFIGDDINDLDAMKGVGFKACPLDASAEVKEIADFVSSRDGGEGAVREVIEHILKKQDQWKKVLENFEYTNQ